MSIFTVGHSTRSLEDFIGLLKNAGSDMVVDVRRMPRSRWQPQFNKDALARTLPEAGIAYIHLPELGGHREAQPHSRNTLWRAGGGLQGYADYAETRPFHDALAKIVKLGLERNPALMCAEADWRNCHRQIIKDYLVARNIPVTHIMKDGFEEGTLTKGAAVMGETVLYAGEPRLL